LPETARPSGTGASLARQVNTLQVNPDGDRFADQTGWALSPEEAHPRKVSRLSVKGNQLLSAKATETQVPSKASLINHEYQPAQVFWLKKTP
jgi:hypothetical protein